MRPYLVLCLAVLIAVGAAAQQPVPPPSRIFGPCFYGCGPFVPLVTTPMVSLQQASPNPVGASNATTGLVAGATNSTLSQISGDTSSVHTEAVWYQGGDAPLTSPEIRLWPMPIGHAMHPMMSAMVHAEHERPQAKGAWIYFSGSEFSTPAATEATAARTSKKAARTYTNADVERQNDANGTVKYDSKTEKLQ